MTKNAAFSEPKALHALKGQVIRVKEKKSPSFFSRLVLILCACLMSLHLWAQETFDISDAPGDLSAAHTDFPGLKSCSKCHTEDLEVLPAKCLSCHQEISLRISQNRGYHRDKGDDCIVCHSEHQGADESIVFLDPEDFDHEQTGAILKGIHLEVKDCRRCHRKDNTLPRKKTHSYLYKDSGCLVCHTSPHPGHQENCLACHNQKSWEVDIWISGGIR
jgi:hypothetical protein